MKILKVIHGYPPYYNAGSEVYSSILCKELANHYEVQVFTRFENIFMKDFSEKTILDPTDPRIIINMVNVPRSRYLNKLIHTQVNEIFNNIINKFKPDLIHFGHLNYLSLSLPSIASSITQIFTLHDFWLICSRGRFIQRNSENLLTLCDGQENKKCANKCFSGYFLGDDNKRDANYWESWIENRMNNVKESLEHIDHFIAPSKFLMDKFINEFGISYNKISYLDYGFDLSKLKNRARLREKEFVFGYIGTHTPEKGVDLLLEAFAKLSNNSVKLRIWGHNQEETKSLKMLADSLNINQKIQWRGYYTNENIVSEVFNHVDAIIVPSIWAENSPLVIHEAQQLRIPVITANYGGMSEYVKDGYNGLLFKHRDVISLAENMLKMINDNKLYNKLSKNGYLYSNSGDVISIKDHVSDLEKIYYSELNKNNVKITKKPGPWRITFDTNPDYCNYKCIMCECFSPYSKVKQQKESQGIKPKIMPIETIRRIIEEAKDTPLREIIPSTMGEPLMYKHFDEIINMCHEFGLKLNLTTNGSFPVKGARKWAELLVPVLSDIKISWNGVSKETNEAIMIGSKWEDSLQNLKDFLEIRDKFQGKKCSVTLQLTFLESNFTELYEIIDMAIDLGIDRVKGHHLWAHFDEIKNLSMRKDEESVARWNKKLEKIYELKKLKKLKNGNEIILENFTIIEDKDDIAKGGICPFLGKEAWIDPTGKFSPCCAPDDLRSQLGNFGNVNSKSIADIWESQEYKELQKNYLSFDLCKKCNMKKNFIG